jgi:flagellar biosynthetic protein FliR
MSAAGDMVNLQMGLSASSLFDPSTREQTSDIGKFFGFLSTVIFINAGGLYWMFAAFERGFAVFPLYNTVIPLDKILNINYLILLTSNVLFIGLQIAAPVLIATLAMDIILGIISKTAPQVNVFQLSFLFKPLLGVAILIIIMPLLMNVINDFFVSYSGIY